MNTDDVDLVVDLVVSNVVDVILAVLRPVRIVVSNAVDVSNTDANAVTYVDVLDVAVAMFVMNTEVYAVVVDFDVPIAVVVDFDVSISVSNVVDVDFDSSVLNTAALIVSVA